MDGKAMSTKKNDSIPAESKIELESRQEEKHEDINRTDDQ
jgi:hypothetical protein